MSPAHSPFTPWRRRAAWLAPLWQSADSPSAAPPPPPPPPQTRQIQLIISRLVPLTIRYGSGVSLLQSVQVRPIRLNVGGPERNDLLRLRCNLIIFTGYPVVLKAWRVSTAKFSSRILVWSVLFEALSELPVNSSTDALFWGLAACGGFLPGWHLWRNRVRYRWCQGHNCEPCLLFTEAHWIPRN